MASRQNSGFVDFKDLKARISITQILEHYSLLPSLKAVGDRLSGPCPIHGGSNATHFRANVSKNCWNCFGTCKGGGNIIDFVARKENIPFREAALRIQEWFNAFGPATPSPTTQVAETPAPLPEKVNEVQEPAPALPAPAEPEASGPNEPLKFELKNLDVAHPYLALRGLTAESIVEFGLGYCAKGSMRGRIVIPIHNDDGQLVAYAGRWPGAPEADAPKYKFPAGFRKTRELFNAHRASQEEERPLVIVEGFFNCFALHQHGVLRVVALMGCSMSAEQEETILVLTGEESRIVVMLDDDQAGKAGSSQIVERLSRARYVRTLSFPPTEEELSESDLDTLRG